MNSSPSPMPVAIDERPMIIFSTNTSLLRCLSDIPSVISMPNSRFLAFRKALAEYSKNKKEKIKMRYCEIFSPIVPTTEAVTLLDASCP
ncbi:hypothetical protein D3C78_721750 [compost metagenome]